MCTAAAERCIEIIGKRTPLNQEEINLLARIVNDIRVEFDLPGAVHPSKLEDGAGQPPKEWFW
ncbi:hypothetical protein [Geomonas subterranea]|uniref:hypothetical protein n=1 Tax=Geomonas subterranea TaxID=2847989 RepID=UPI001CD7A100|nr:hypothetical protein [Geomonas fuzhouensis]